MCLRGWVIQREFLIPQERSYWSLKDRELLASISWVGWRAYRTTFCLFQLYLRHVFSYSKSFGLVRAGHDTEGLVKAVDSGTGYAFYKT